ncbi:PDZ domain-containing protein [Nonomuraea sp. MG754425]|uniref:S1C family serine protease n=1 Tax=Nonomuraea sp. MG754425 TaxID=2570319 RepID=UPI001F32617A|nr:PDZ domain-containing protein [Nonomuraea sp. MG754425]MCF6467856.1 PDZ domain-containing protein [Nonomuraea sp. MG754425]
MRPVIACLGAMALIAPAPPGVAQAASTYTTAAAAVEPQQEVPELDAPGAEQPVTFPPDRRTRPSPGTYVFTAPRHTRITRLEMNCRPPCAEAIATDGSTATVRTPPGRWRWSLPVRVWLQAGLNAPVPRARYSGSLTVDGERQPLDVIITEGRPGLFGIVRADTPDNSGALVSAVTPGGPADQAGIRAGDVIVSFNGKTVTNAREQRAARMAVRGGATVPVTYRRPDGSVRTTEVTLADAPPGTPA